MKFLRRTWKRYAKLGKGRKKKQMWKKPTGRDNKMREKRRGYPAVVSIGYKKNKELKKNIIVIRNLKDLEEVKKNGIIIIGNIGKKKKIEILQKAKEKKVLIHSINTEKFLKKNLKIKEKKETETVSKKEESHRHSHSTKGERKK